MSFELQILNDVLDWARAPGGSAEEDLRPSGATLWLYPREKAFQVHERTNRPSSILYNFESPYGGLVTLKNLCKKGVDSADKNYKIETGPRVENLMRKRKLDGDADSDSFHLREINGVKQRSFKKPRGYACKNCCMYSHI
ncbi:LAQU0S05e02454g1_1 [Lachancea quebecensis]|uniref:LAQU0S05e02454g1_1 n=1 Tax=Lachancea quebecensis TaxID=1654605 RepID=A0A0P1KRF6_9SACH|nr:LAQU0S05e02454g1_1 [Lachancea quebecensis]